MDISALLGADAVGSPCFTASMCQNRDRWMNATDQGAIHMQVTTNALIAADGLFTNGKLCLILRDQLVLPRCREISPSAPRVRKALNSW